MKYLTFLLLAITFTVTSVLAQSIDISNRANQPLHPVDLTLNIRIDDLGNQAPAGLVVRLTSDYSFVARNASAQEATQQTDRSGTVIFHTLTGAHEIHISGEGLVDYVRTVELLQQQTQDTETIVVRSKHPGAQAAVVPPGARDTVSAAQYNVPDKAAKEFKSGSKALEAKDYTEAKKRFANATTIYADYGLAYNGMGVAQMSSGDASGARASFQKAITIDDHFAEAYRNLARISLSEHNFEEMDDLLTKSLQTDPLNAWALTYAAYAELQTRKFDLAITHARAANDVPHPGLASVHIVAANALQATGQDDEALKEYQAYLKEDPNGRDAERAKQAIASLGGAASK
jgi:tetratricopeptide (TPR) repeat protein